MFCLLFLAFIFIWCHHAYDDYNLSPEEKLAKLQTNPKPNFIILFADDLGYGDLSYIGHPTIATPNIDALAYAGKRLTQWYSGFHVCSPSRAALLTGRLCVRSGCCGGWGGGVFTQNAVGGLPTNETTFAKILDQVGYTSMVIGKWHLGNQLKFLPLSHGFDHYFGVPYSVDMGQSVWLMSHGAWTWPPLPILSNNTVIEQPADLSTLASRYASESVNFIQNSVSTSSPFLLYIPFSHVHVPLYSSIANCNSSTRGFYGNAIQEMDWIIGRIMRKVNELKIDKNTLTIFTSDNGPARNKLAGGSQHLFRDGKGTTWEGGIRMPSFANWPGMIDKGTISMELTATYDIFNTIINIANATNYVLDNITYDGKDMSDILFFNGKSKHDCLYIYGGTPNATDCPIKNDTNKNYAKCAGLWAVRCGAYKAHWVTRHNGSVKIEDPPLLYNLNMDPSELHPIWPDNEAYNGIINMLSNKKWEHITTLQKGITNQILLGRNNDTALCMDVHSKDKYPQYPNCTGSPNNWNASVCDPVCLAEDSCGTSYPGVFKQL